MVVPLFSTKKRCHWESPSLMGFRATELSYLGLIQLSLPGPRNELQCECTLTRSHDNGIYAPRQHRLLPNVRTRVENHSTILVNNQFQGLPLTNLPKRDVDFPSALRPLLCTSRIFNHSDYEMFLRSCLSALLFQSSWWRIGCELSRLYQTCCGWCS